MTPRWIQPGDGDYPAKLTRDFAGNAIGAISVIGDLQILDTKSVGLICSVRCPGSVILNTYDIIRELRDAGVTVIGGFHSPMEKECLSILLRGRQQLVVCPARSLAGMQIPKE